MAQIVLAGDNHGDISSIQYILNNHPDADYYLHTGDSCLKTKEIAPFISVKGNNDYFNDDLPSYRLLDIEGHKILLIHGEKYAYSVQSLLMKAQENKADIVFFGHTHVFFYKEFNGITLINPGSTYYNRNGEAASYALIELNESSITVIRKKII